MAAAGEVEDNLKGKGKQLADTSFTCSSFPWPAGESYVYILLTSSSDLDFLFNFLCNAAAIKKE